MGKKILLTGCSRGLGSAMAESFVARGHALAACARNEEAVDVLREKWGSAHYLQAADVSSDSTVKDFCDSAFSHFGGAPDLVINNAALMNRSADLWEMTATEISDLLAVNVEGVCHVIRHCVPAMINQGSGVIVNFSSYWGRSTSSQVAPYCASKFAIEGLTSALAQELPAGLAAVAFNPGVIHTDMLQSCFGPAASAHISPEGWVTTAVPFLESLGPEHNGQSVTAPGQ